jgi:hypothetical protein
VADPSSFSSVPTKFANLSRTLPAALIEAPAVIEPAVVAEPGSRAYRVVIVLLVFCI